MKQVLVLNGPNLNLLGTREPGTYGVGTLADLQALCTGYAADHGIEVEFRHSNHEGVLIDWLHDSHAAYQAGDLLGILLNAGAYTHTSLALADAIRAVATPVIEVHLSNVFAREAFRHHSYLSPVVRGVVCGFGPLGYLLAMQALLALSGLSAR